MCDEVIEMPTQPTNGASPGKDCQVRTAAFELGQVARGAFTGRTKPQSLRFSSAC